MNFDLLTASECEDFSLPFLILVTLQKWCGEQEHMIYTFRALHVEHNVQPWNT